jgi:hypothetical protein
VSAEGLGLSPERSHYHSNSGGPDCARVFKSLRIAPGSVAVDLGSGKGGAVMTLRELPFAEVIGVEISPELINIATTNVARLGLRDIRFVQSDAAAFTDFDRVTHIYMYNPFPCSIVVEVMANIAASIAAADREVTLVYRNPVCDEAIRAAGLFGQIESLKLNEHEWIIYRHVPQPAIGAKEPRRAPAESSALARSSRRSPASATLAFRRRQE